MPHPTGGALDSEPPARSTAVMPALLDGPYFDDLRVGQVLEPAPPITIDRGMTAAYQALVGDPLRVALAEPVAEAVAGVRGGLVNPALVLHVSIGQSTVATRRVIANLFYRGVAVQRPVPVGTTLHTTVDIRALRETSRKEGRARRGMVLLGVRTVDGDGEVIADYERCPLLPFRDEAADIDHADDVGPASGSRHLSDWARFAPTSWDLAPLGPPTPWAIGETAHDPMRDTVTDAPSLVRLTQNQAAAHRDARLGQRGKRLVYGGHTIGLAQASLVRMLPNMATVVGWHSCDHTGPVFEDDVLSVTATLDAQDSCGPGRLLAFTVIVHAEREGEPAPLAVLDWKPVVYSA